MIRWASGGLGVLLVAAAALGQRADAIREVSDLLERAQRPNPFGGPPIPALPRFVNQPVPVPRPPGGGPGGGAVPDDPAGRVPLRPIRPPAPTPGGPARTDRHGDPLPAGALARFGTIRLRHGNEPAALLFTPDGRQLASVSATEDGVRLWDPVSGKELARVNTPVSFAAFARDGTVVLADGDKCRVWTPQTKTVRDLPEGSLPENTTVLALHPDSRTLAAATLKRIALIDLVTGKPKGEYKLPADQPLIRMVYSPDARWLAAAGQKTGVMLWDLRTGKRVRTYRTEADVCDFAFSHDGTRIAIAAEQLRVFPTDAEEVADGYAAPEGQFLSPRFTADAKWVIAAAPDGTITRIDAATGEQKDTWAAPDQDLRQPFAISPDGALAAAVDQSGGIRVWDPKTGKGPEVERLPMLYDPGLSADGKTASCLDNISRVHVFDPLTGKPVKVIELPIDESTPVTYDAASNRAVAVVGSDDPEVHVIDVAANKVLCKVPAPGGGMPFAVFCPGDPDKVGLFCPGSVAVLSVSAGKVVRTFGVGQQENVVRGSLSPDGRLAAVTTHPLSVWEVATGRKRFEIDALPNPEGAVFSRDGRLVAAWDSADSVVIFDVRTGTSVRRFRLPGGDGSIFSAAFTPDGKRLVTGGRDGMTTLWDVTTGEALLALDRHEGMVTGFAFSADGTRLVSTGMDGTALVWDVSAKPVEKLPEAAVAGFDEALRLLGSGDPAQAQRGIDYLYRHPAEAVKLLGEKITPAAATPAEKIAKLVAALDDEDFQTRKSAAKDLEAIGPEAAAALRAAAEKSASPEVRKAATDLLAKLDGPPSKPEELRAVRAVEVLEVIGTPEAREALKKFAAGPPAHRLTIEAAAALARLDRKPAR